MKIADNFDNIANAPDSPRLVVFHIPTHEEFRLCFVNRLEHLTLIDLCLVLSIVGLLQFHQNLSRSIFFSFQ